MRIKFFILFKIIVGYITVYEPEALKKAVYEQNKEGAIASIMSNYGNPPYGSKMTGMLYIPTPPNACE